MSRNRVSFADHAWLRMDDPQNLMIITGLMTFEAPLGLERLKAHVQDTLLVFERFKQRLAPSRIPLRRPAWEYDTDFDLDAHIELVEFDEPVDQALLQDLLSVAMSAPLDYSRPLWKLYLVEKYGAGSAMIARLHHSLADGISLMQVLLSMTSESPDGPPGVQSLQDAMQQTGKAALLNNNAIGARGLWDEGRKLVTEPAHLRGRIRQGMGLAAAVGTLAVRLPDPATLFKGALRVEKRCAWSNPLQLAEVKETGKAFGATINDVLIACTAGALGQYLARREAGADDLNLRGLIPINLRPVALDQDLGNKFGLLFLTLPVGEADPVERLYQVKQNMDGLKSSYEPLATYGVLNLLGAVPGWTEEIAVSFFDSKCTAVLTNVPGPRTKRYLAGSPIDMVMGWVPQSGRIALGISILSYNGCVWLGVATDEGLVPDPEAIVAFFEAEFELLKARAKDSPAPTSLKFSELLKRLDAALEAVDEMLDDSGKPEKEQQEAG